MDAQVALAPAVATHCPYCALQCGMMLQETEAGWTVGARDFPTNKGGLCRKGWTSAEVLAAPDRLTTPMLRDSKSAALRPAEWDEALDFVAAGMARAQAAHGRDAVAVFGGGGLTNEKAYLLGKFARKALRTANIDYNGRFCMASAAVAGIKAFGIDRGLPFPLADIPEAEAVLIAGGNPAETMPPIMQYFDAQRGAGGKLIVVDPRRSETAKRASLHLQVTPGTDLALAHGMLHVAVREKLIDLDFIEARTTGFEDVRRLVASWWPDRVERVTGVPARLVVQAAHIMGEAATAMVLSGRGAEQQVSGVDNVLGFINLLLALGKAGKPYCGYGCLTGQGNGQGGREHGQKADQLPGYRKIEVAADRAAVAAVWGMAAADLPGAGKPAVELLAALGGEIKALLVFGSNLVVSAPDNGGVAGRLKSLDLLMVADLFLSETAALADVVLPVAQWAEEEGTMTNLEGRVLLRRQAKALPDGVRTDTAILAGLAERLGVDGFVAEPAVIFEEMARASAGGAADYGGVSWARVAAGEALFWPCPDASHAGTPRMFQESFGTADQRARFHAVAYRGPAEPPDAEYPLVLTTGRVLVQYQTGTQTKRVPDLLAASPEAFAEINPDTARGIGVADGAMMRLITRRGAAVLKARYSREIRFDTVFVPFHWAAANLLTNAAVDPVSRIPEFKVCAARAELFATGM